MSLKNVWSVSGRQITRNHLYYDGRLWLVHFDLSIVSLFRRVAVLSAVPCCVVFFDHGHPCLRNLNSTIPVDVVRVKSYMDSFLDPMSVQVRIAINKLTLSWGKTTLSWGETSFQIVSWACSETAEDGARGTVVSPQVVSPQITQSRFAPT